MVEMHNLKNWNEYLNEAKKGYGDEYDIARLKKGDCVVYQGTSYYVLDIQDAVIELGKQATDAIGTGILVNQAMFNQNGYIA